MVRLFVPCIGRQLYFMDNLFSFRNSLNCASSAGVIFKGFLATIHCTDSLHGGIVKEPL